MDPARQTHLAALRELLVDRRSELLAEVDAAQLAVLPHEGLVSREVTDRKDEAMQRTAGDIGEAEARRDLDELAQVEAALRRLDEGRYGDCADCGEPIALERLRVQPAALRCTACQAAFEARWPISASPRG
jgi:DnaK suppressor protein